MDEFGRTIRDAKIESNLSMREIGEILMVNQRTVESWVQGRRCPEPYCERLIIAEILRHKKDKKTKKV